MQYPSHLLHLMQLLKKLPGVGTRSAERYAFQLLSWRHDELSSLSEAIEKLATKLRFCTECGALIDERDCLFCHSPRRDRKKLCVIASPRDLFSIEETGEFCGLYHVLKGLLSPLEGIGIEAIDVEKLKTRIAKDAVEEVVLALDSSVEGDATALYLKRELGTLPLQISRLAFGLPMGSSLDYVDEGTLARALKGRSLF